MGQTRRGRLSSDSRRVSIVGAISVCCLLSCGSGDPTSGRTRCEPLSTEPSADHWVEWDASPVILVGDSVTQGWQELGENFDQFEYLDALARRGINAVLLWSFIGLSDQVKDERIGYDSPEIFPWVRVEGKFDLTRFDEPYFHRLRSFAEYALERRIAVIVTVHDGWTKTRFEGHPFNRSNGGALDDRAAYVELASYGKEMPSEFDPQWSAKQKHQYYLERFCEQLIIALAGLPNVMFEILNEGEWYPRPIQAKFQMHFVEFFDKRTDQLIIVNDDEIHDDRFHREGKVDVVSHHLPNWNHDSTAASFYLHFGRQFGKPRPKPYMFTETVPEFAGGQQQLDAIMRVMWGSVMGGAGIVVQNDASFGFDPSARAAAVREDRDRLLDLEGHLSRFFNDAGVNFTEMAQHSGLSPDCVVLANPGTEYVVYSQSGEKLRIDLRDAHGPMQSRFYDPRGGVFEATREVEGGDWRTLVKPTKQDWVLHIASRDPGES